MRPSSLKPASTHGDKSASPFNGVLATAKSLCDERNKRLTRLRFAALKALAESDHPLTAYNLLERVRSTRKRRLDAASIYRVLNFWMALGLVTRIASRNAYVIKADPTISGNPVMFLCASCNKSATADVGQIAKSIERDAALLGFRLQTITVECSGLCPSCAEHGEDLLAERANDKAVSGPLAPSAARGVGGRRFG
ncbi:MAG: transcriptional repressor [Alphaproteobacteria bacterium]|nr:transcriptional repressor [Alphaproteobacteria bacterium]MBV8407564.1 transcriptional repressor [Alphaproteobacteria bacterium]